MARVEHYLFGYVYDLEAEAYHIACLSWPRVVTCATDISDIEPMAIERMEIELELAVEQGLTPPTGLPQGDAKAQHLEFGRMVFEFYDALKQDYGPEFTGLDNNGVVATTVTNDELIREPVPEVGLIDIPFDIDRCKAVEPFGRTVPIPTLV